MAAGVTLGSTIQCGLWGALEHPECSPYALLITIPRDQEHTALPAWIPELPLDLVPHATSRREDDRYEVHTELA